jgi:hypothetical protein
LFKKGGSAVEIYKLLTSKVPKFKVALEVPDFTTINKPASVTNVVAIPIKENKQEKESIFAEG